MDLNNKEIEEAVLKQNGTLLKEISTSQMHIKVVRRVKGRTNTLNNVTIFLIEKEFMLSYLLNLQCG
ncbi:unnamed protein product [Parnassius apollo]|uniref:(apollo) hypothetical protein n=1 Tax=Parnassius apollo TaxID=110799 RepID=A0A8S3Y4H5_PARAO|nr:unnamed protein product [Parnassius apollo]